MFEFSDSSVAITSIRGRHEGIFLFLEHDGQEHLAVVTDSDSWASLVTERTESTLTITGLGQELTRVGDTELSGGSSNRGELDGRWRAWMGRGLFPIVYEILGDRVISGFASDGGALIGNFLFSENPSSQEMIEFLFDDGSIEVATIRTLTDNTLTMLVDGEESKWHFTHAS